MRTFAIHTLGCRVNHYESRQIASLLKSRGLVETDLATAELRVVNTCSVTTEAAAKSGQSARKMVRLPVLRQTTPPDDPQTSIGSLPGNGRVVVTGCWATSNTADAREIPGVDAVLTHHGDVAAELHALLDRWTEASGERSIRPNAGTTSLPLLHEHQSSHQRAFLKIQDGCDAHCTYCIIPQLRPRVWSKSVEDTVDEAKRLVDAGHVEIVLTGIFLGAYGQPTALRRRQPFDTARPLAELIEALCTRVDGLRRLRLSSMEPGDLTPELLAVAQSFEQVVPHFHLPLQSGSNRILRRMNRQYTRDDYLHMVDMLATAYDRPAITTDVIAGFPGETDEDFSDTLDVIRAASAIHVHAFPYSPRPNTAAARWENDFVPPHIAQRRMRAIEGLMHENDLAFRQSFVGQRATILVERPGRDTPVGAVKGRTERYFEVIVEGVTASAGQLVETMIERVENDQTFGVSISEALVVRV